MASVTVTELGVVVVVQMNRDQGGDSVKYSAISITDVPAIAGRQSMDVDITAELTAPQLAIVQQVLGFIEAKAKSAWDIP